jgi:hypothetical protein
VAPADQIVDVRVHDRDGEMRAPTHYRVGALIRLHPHRLELALLRALDILRRGCIELRFASNTAEVVRLDLVCAASGSFCRGGDPMAGNRADQIRRLGLRGRTTLALGGVLTTTALLALGKRLAALLACRALGSGCRARLARSCLCRYSLRCRAAGALRGFGDVLAATAFRGLGDRLAALHAGSVLRDRRGAHRARRSLGGRLPRGIRENSCAQHGNRDYNQHQFLHDRTFRDHCPCIVGSRASAKHSHRRAAFTHEFGTWVGFVPDL